MEKFDQYVKSMKANSAKEFRKSLSDLLASLQALHWLYLTYHWKYKSDYDTHLLFQRFYEAIPDEIDSLAEKMVGFLGDQSIVAKSQMQLATKYVSQWEDDDAIKSSMSAEKSLQELIKSTYDLGKNNGMTLGLDDFLMSLANDHETNIYLLSRL